MEYKREKYSWNSMKNRCLNKKYEYYYLYGGRGISFCKRWNKFENFLKDMGARPKNKTLERINTNKNYQPSNCKWATIKQQNRNKRNNVYLIMGKQKKIITDWAKFYNMPYTSFKRKISEIGFPFGIISLKKLKCEDCKYVTTSRKSFSNHTRYGCKNK